MSEGTKAALVFRKEIDAEPRHASAFIPGTNWTRVIAVVAILHLIVGFAIWLAPSVDSTIPSSTISAEQGAAYLAPISPSTRFPYTLRSDTGAAPTASRLLLFEEGKALGPAHVVHADIRQSGGGRYSHWNDGIYFSASDGGDPRTNGRTYSYESSTTLHPASCLRFFPRSRCCSRTGE